MRRPVPAQLAATVILVRDGLTRPELFMVRRHHGADFMPNAHVFAGGKLEDEDSAPALLARCRGLDEQTAKTRLGLEPAKTALGLYVAALRETFEEAGVLVAERADGAAPEPRLCAELRRQLVSGEQGFAALLEGAGLWLRVDRLRYLERWVTPDFQPRRFDAFFFVCAIPRDQRATHDARETTAGGWFTAPRLLVANLAEELQLPPPTLCVVEALAPLSDVAQVLACAGDRPVAPRQPKPLLGGGVELTLLLPEDRRYEDPCATTGPEHYVVLRGRHFERVRRG